jgi:AAA domain-containing protein
MTQRDIWRLGSISEPVDVYNSDAMDALGEAIDFRKFRSTSPNPTPTFSRIINPAEWEGLPVPPRKWIVPDYIPDATVTMLAGDGGTGKSLLAMQLAVGRAVARVDRPSAGTRPDAYSFRRRRLR